MRWYIDTGWEACSRVIWCGLSEKVAGEFTVECREGTSAKIWRRMLQKEETICAKKGSEKKTSFVCVRDREKANLADLFSDGENEET